MNINIYNKEFYDRQMHNSYNSAKIILEHIFGVYRPKSIIDFGCGAGTWLKAAYELNNMQGKYVGLDGDWGAKDELMPEFIDFRKTDFSREYFVNEKFDLAISLEVAEHIPQKYSSSFVNSIVNSSDVVLFSAAIPGQGGVNHINEQYQSYWYTLFKENGYECFDIIRSVFWSDNRVGVGYRQNALVYVKRKSGLLEIFAKFDIVNLSLLDIVHPIVLERHTKPEYEKYYLVKRFIKNILHI
jgi:SAM-dependent methyltransferase